MQINNFSGGLNIRQDPCLLATNEAVKYANIDNSKGTLASEKGPLKVGESVDNFFYVFEGQNFSSKNFRYYVEYDKKLYYTEDTAGAYKYYNGKTYNMGIAAPVPQPAFDEDRDPIFDSNFSQIVGLVITEEDFVKADFLEEVDKIDGSMAAATYNYRVFVMVDNKQIFYFDEAVSLTLNQAARFTFKTNHTMVLTRKHTDNKYYRIIQGRNILTDRNSSSTLNTTVGNEVVVNITTDKVVTQWTYTYYNSEDDTESVPTTYTTETYQRPYAKKIKLTNFTPPADSQVDYIRLYRMDSATNGAMVRVGDFPVIRNDTGVSSIAPVYDYSLSSDLTTVLDSFSNNPPPVGLTYIVEAYATLFGAVGRYLYFSRIDGPSYWPPTNAIYFDADITGIQPVADGILVNTRNKTYIVVGTSVDDFRKLPLSREHGCISHRTHKLVKNSPIWISGQGIVSYSAGQITVLSRLKLGEYSFNVINAAVSNESYWVLTTDYRLIGMDLRYEPIFKTVFLGKRIYDIGGFNDKLYANVEGSLSTMFDGDLLPIAYTSPNFTEGVISNTKSYNVVYVLLEGEFNIKTLINDEIVQEDTFYHTKKKMFEIKVPQAKQTGNCIQFDILGTGVIYEIEYKTLGRNNGR